MRNITLGKAMPYILVIAGVIGYICSFIIMNDKVKLFENPHFIPSCSLNPIISCGTVMQSKQANAFGFPNPFIGLGAYPVLAVVGIIMLQAARFKRWFWLAIEGGLVLGTAFAYWLLFESVYRIHALCPFCLTIDFVTTITIWYTTLYIIDNDYLKLPAGKTTQVYGWIRKHHLDILILVFLILFAIILKHFWYYYRYHLPFGL